MEFSWFAFEFRANFLVDLFYFHRARQFDLAEESLIRGNITRQLYRYVSYF